VHPHVAARQSRGFREAIKVRLVNVADDLVQEMAAPMLPSPSTVKVVSQHDMAAKARIMGEISSESTDR